MKKLLALLVVLGLVFVAGGYLLPTTHAVERTVTIQAEPAAIGPYIQDLKTWEQWTVWNTTDIPTLKVEYGGSDAGAGASMAWNEDAGNGTIEISKLDGNGGVWYDITMDYMGAMSAVGHIQMTEENGATTVTWEDTVTNTSMRGRWMGLLSDMFLGQMLETNLENLKSKSEGS